LVRTQIVLAIPTPTAVDTTDGTDGIEIFAVLWMIVEAISTTKDAPSCDVLNAALMNRFNLIRINPFGSIPLTGLFWTLIRSSPSASK
jgi:hypothetical protein